MSAGWGGRKRPGCARGATMQAFSWAHVVREVWCVASAGRRPGERAGLTWGGDDAGTRTRGGWGGYMWLGWAVW